MSKKHVYRRHYQKKARLFSGVLKRRPGERKTVAGKQESGMQTQGTEQTQDYRSRENTSEAEDAVQ
jgi:hypothetical protein